MVVARRNVDDSARFAAFSVMICRILALLDVRNDVVDDSADVLMGIAMRPLRYVLKVFCCFIHSISIHKKILLFLFALLSYLSQSDHNVIVTPPHQQYTCGAAIRALCAQAVFAPACTYADFLSETSVRPPSIVNVSTIAPRMT